MRRSLILLALLIAVPTAQASELWFGGRTHPAAKKRSIVDGGEMFTPDAAWPELSARTAVMEFGPGDIMQANDAALTAVFADLRRRHIALSLNGALLEDTDSCVARNEAYLLRVDQIMSIVNKVKRDGGDPRYFAMDEPFFYGNRWTGPKACHESARAIAARIRDNVSRVRQVFPHMLIGDIEVVDGSPEWNQALADWVDTYREVTGEKLAFMQTDTAWSELALHNMVGLAALMRARGVPFGVIYTADARVTTDKEWTDSSLSHLAELEGPLGLHPDLQIVQSWVEEPSHALPETEDGTLTNVALRLTLPAPQLRLERTRGGIVGHLRDAAGHPIAGARVRLESLDSTQGVALPHDLHGVVPDGAVTGEIVLRAGNEGACVCAGPSEVRFGPVAYTEEGGERSVADPGPLGDVELSADAPHGGTLARIRVTAGARYRLQANMVVPEAADHAGYVGVIFRDAANHGLGRGFLWFEPLKPQLGVVVTDAAGRFRVPETVRSVRATYLGGAQTHPVMADLGG
jgi:hypothetical protein